MTDGAENSGRGISFCVEYCPQALGKGEVSATLTEGSSVIMNDECKQGEYTEYGRAVGKLSQTQRVHFRERFQKEFTSGLSFARLADLQLKGKGSA